MRSVSIIIPTYNRADQLPKALDSLRGQTYLNWEALVVDDGSEDSTGEVMQEWCRQDERIKFFPKEPNWKKGACACRNRGIAEARGDYLLFLDSDDWLRDFCLEQRLKEAELSPGKDVYFFPTLIFREKTEEYFLWNDLAQDDILLGFLTGNPICQTSGGLWRRTSLEGHLKWDENLHLWQDLDFHITALMAGFKFKVCANCEPDAIILEQPNSISRSGYNELPKLISRKYAFKKWMALTSSKNWMDKYWDSFRIIGWNIYLNILKTRNWQMEREMFAEVKEAVLFSKMDLMKLRGLKTLWYIRAYRYLRMSCILKYIAARFSVGQSSLGKIPYVKSESLIQRGY